MSKVALPCVAATLKTKTIREHMKRRAAWTRVRNIVQIHPPSFGPVSTARAKHAPYVVKAALVNLRCHAGVRKSRYGLGRAMDGEAARADCVLDMLKKAEDVSREGRNDWEVAPVEGLSMPFSRGHCHDCSW